MFLSLIVVGLIQASKYANTPSGQMVILCNAIAFVLDGQLVTLYNARIKWTLDIMYFIQAIVSLNFVVLS